MIKMDQNVMKMNDGAANTQNVALMPSQLRFFFLRLFLCLFVHALDFIVFSDPH